MKIGILTQPLMLNYGGLLQAYALQLTLKRMGHDAWIINRRHSYKPLWYRMGSMIKWFIKEKVINNGSAVACPYYPTSCQLEIIGQFTSEFSQKNIYPVTSPIFSNTGMKYEIEHQSFDAYIVGSDQVWRPCYSPCITNYFLDFLGLKKIRRIAYSASFGVDTWEFTPSQTLKCSALAKKFDAISVREDSGIQLCREYLKVEAIQTLDPTLLLNKSDYLQLIEENEEEISKGDLLTYILDATIEKQAIADTVASQLGLTLFSVMPLKVLNKKTENDIESCIYPSVTKWLRGFMDAEFVIVDSFHGCVFSIIFNKPFIVIGNEERGMARFTSLLKMFDLESRLVFSRDDLKHFESMNDIDWKMVNSKRESWMKLSSDYLKINLEK